MLGGLGSCVASTAAACACSCCTTVTRQAIRSSARAGWSVLFSISLIVAWLARDFGSAVLKKLPCEDPRARPGLPVAALLPLLPTAMLASFGSLLLLLLLLLSYHASWLLRHHCSHHGASFPRAAAGIVRHFAGDDLPSDAWFGQQAVYRISLGNFVSFVGRVGSST